MKQVLVIICLIICLSAFSKPETGSRDILPALQSKLTEILKGLEPAASIRLKGRQLIVEYRTRSFMVHASDKTGRMSEKAHEETGPDYRGLRLTLTLQEGKYTGAAKIPQELRKPYWHTYLNAYPIDRGKRHLHTMLSYGSRTDRKLIGKIKLLLESIKQGTQPDIKAAPDVPELGVEFSKFSTWSLGTVAERKPIFADRKYAFKKIPTELKGAKYILRPVGKVGGWSTGKMSARAWTLKKRDIRVSRPCTCYVAMWLATGDTVHVTASKLKALKRSGWEVLDEPFTTTTARYQSWKWLVIKRTLKRKGDVRFPDVARLNGATILIFMFK